MRLTGQSTTALGNAIVNMLVHCEFVNQNIKDLCWYVILGDDVAMGFKKRPITKDLGKRIAMSFNMQSKYEINKHYS